MQQMIHYESNSLLHHKRNLKTEIDIVLLDFTCNTKEKDGLIEKGSLGYNILDGTIPKRS